MSTLRNCQKINKRSSLRQWRSSERSVCCLTVGCDLVVQKIPLPRVLLHGQNDSSEEAEARVAAQLVHKTVHEAFTNHNQVLVNSTGNVMKEVFYGAPVD
jgi:hypothetical protein